MSFLDKINTVPATKAASGPVKKVNPLLKKKLGEKKDSADAPKKKTTPLKKVTPLKKDAAVKKEEAKVSEEKAQEAVNNQEPAKDAEKEQPKETAPTKTEEKAPKKEAKEEIKAAEIEAEDKPETKPEAPKSKKAEDKQEKLSEESKEEIREEVKEEAKAEPKKEESKKKTAASRSKKKTTATKKEEEDIEPTDIPTTTVSYNEAIQTITSPFVDEEWEEYKAEVQKELSEIVISDDMNPGTLKVVISELSILREKVWFSYQEQKTLYERLSSKDPEGLIERVKRINLGSGNNDMERKRAGVLACMKFNTESGDINLYEVLDETRSRYNFLKAVIDSIKYKTDVLITLNGALKLEKEHL